jgi:hypothetical protein
MAGRLEQFREEIADHVRWEHPIAEQAALLWRIIYTIVDGYRQERPGWLFARYEDLAQNPVSGFESIFAELNLEMTDRVRAGVLRYSRPHGPAADGKMVIQRDSQAAAESWRHRLTPEEIDTVRKGVAGISERFYTDADW